jgi:hypothetical protein
MIINERIEPAVDEAVIAITVGFVYFLGINDIFCYVGRICGSSSGKCLAAALNCWSRVINESVLNLICVDSVKKPPRLFRYKFAAF